VRTSVNGIINNQPTTVGYVADAVQCLLELGGLKNTGKAVGAIGNTAVGASVGSVAGPGGAVLGGAKGFGSWIAGEVIWDAIMKYFR